jgi:hypothetical protein
LIGRFLLNNYKQALWILKEYVPQIEAFKAAYGFKDDDFLKWHQEESEYLAACKMEPIVDTMKVSYVEALKKLESARYAVFYYYSHIDKEFYFSEAWGRMSTVSWMNYTPDILASVGGQITTSDVHDSTRRKALEKLELALNTVQDLETRLGIEQRWSPENPEYVSATEYVNNRKFIRVVETLEGQVVARLFELSKANLMGTCEPFLLF